MIDAGELQMHLSYYYAGVDHSLQVLPSSDRSGLAEAVLDVSEDWSCYEKLESGLVEAAGNDGWGLQLD